MACGSDVINEVERSDRLVRFAAEIGPSGPVRVVGGDTRYLVGGAPSAAAEVVRAPVGVVVHEPAEMTVRVGAGTALAEVQEVIGRAGQRVILDGPAGCTVGGVLAVGRSGSRRLGDGPVRDALLGAQVVDHTGTLVTIGGATVKNVTGYDLCRLMVGSLGTLGCVAEVILRCVPIAPRSVWIAGPVEPSTAKVLHRPVSVLWDGTITWALVEGAVGAVDDELDRAAKVGLVERPGPPQLPPYRWSTRPSRIASTVDAWSEPFVAEMGVGVIHASVPAPAVAVESGVAAVHQRIRDQFDPSRRFNPGRDPLSVAS